MGRDELPNDQRELYEAGEYGALSAVLEPAAAALVDASGVALGDAVLDVGAGDGNVAVAAARRAARVVAVDLSPLQVRRGEERSAREGLSIQWHVADAESLPFPERRFDCVLSAFGVVAALHPDDAVRELFRVCRPGGIVGLTAWPRGSYMSELTAALRVVVGRETVFPEPELGWGDEEIVRARLRPHAADITITGRPLEWDPTVRAAAGPSDCAAAYFASRLSDAALTRLAHARDAVQQRFRTSDGHIHADTCSSKPEPRAPPHRRVATVPL